MKTKRSVIALLLAVAMLASLSACVSAAANNGSLKNFQKSNTFSSNTFTDVNESDWFYSNVKEAYEYGLMIGNSETTFNPNGDITIAEAIVIAVRIHSTYYGNSYEAEQTSPWYQPYVTYAESDGILTKTYRDYNMAAERSEFAAILAAALPDEALSEINKVEDGDIPDVKLSDTNGESIYKLYRAGVLVGNDAEGTFSPESSIKRSEVAAIVSRMVDPDSRMKKSTETPNSAESEAPTVSDAANENNENLETGDTLNPNSTSEGKQEPEPTASGNPQSSDSTAADSSETNAPNTENQDSEPETSNPTFYISTKNASAGEKNVAITIMVQNNPGLSSIGLYLSYDADLTLTSVVYNDEIGGQIMAPGSLENPVKLIWLSPFEEVNSDQWTLATLYFDVSDSAAVSSHPISLTYNPDDVYNMAEENITFDVVNGAIVVNN